MEDDFFKVYIDYPRQELIERINLRTEEMIENGAIKEVNSFIKLRVRKDKSANKAIGINEIKEYLKNQKNLNDIKEKIAIKTRQYAKRQSTWARGNMMSWMKLKPQDINKFLKKDLELLVSQVDRCNDILKRLSINSTLEDDFIGKDLSLKNYLKEIK